MVDRPTPDEYKKRYQEYRQKALASFPFAQVTAPGDQALATWEGLVAARRGAPVVIGNDDELFRLVESMPEIPGHVRKSAGEIIEIAGGIRHPDDWIRRSADDMAKARERLPQLLQRHPNPPKPDPAMLSFLQGAMPGTVSNPTWEELIAAMSRESQPPIGEWPSSVSDSPELSIALDLRTGAPIPLAHIIIVPTDDWTTIPAHFHWGHWNGCPAPEYHVAALRSWRDRFGAELVGLSHDVMNLRVRQKPKTQLEALELAREHYAYCPDIVDQGVGSLSALAASLMAHEWWYFWWD